MDDEWFRGQAIGLSDSSGWMWTSEPLYRAAGLLHQAWRIGCDRHSALMLRNAHLPTDKTGTRESTSEEVAALIDASLDAVALFLLASALECRLKGHLIASGTSAVSGDGNLEGEFKTHKLRHLALRCGLGLSAADQTTLEALTEFLEWRGRYPIPSNWERLKKLHELSSEVGGSS